MYLALHVKTMTHNSTAHTKRTSRFSNDPQIDIIYIPHHSGQDIDSGDGYPVQSSIHHFAFFHVAEIWSRIGSRKVGRRTRKC